MPKRRTRAASPSTDSPVSLVLDRQPPRYPVVLSPEDHDTLHSPISQQSQNSRGHAADRRKSDTKLRKVSRACDECKKFKKKCSGTYPCNVCTRKGRECLYLMPYGRGRPPTPQPSEQAEQAPARRPQTSRGNSKGAGEDGRTDMRIPGASTETPNTFNPQQPAQSWKQTKTYREAVSRASTEPGITDTHGQFADSSSGLAFLNRAWKRLLAHKPQRITDRDPNDAAESEAHQPQAHAGDKVIEPDVTYKFTLPDPAWAMELVNLYFDVCTATYKCLHRPTVHSWLNTMQQNQQAHRPLEHDIGPSKASVIVTVLAIAMLHHEKSATSRASSQDAAAQSDQVFCVASKLSSSATGFPQLASVQSRLLQVLYLLHTSRMNHAWYLLGDAMRMATALGMHRRDGHASTFSSKSVSGDYILTQTRKRTFWVLYILDQYLGVIFGRPRYFKDSDIDQTFPDIVDDEDMTPLGPKTQILDKDCSAASLVHHTRIVQIVAQITSEVYSIKELPFQQLKQTIISLNLEAKEWKSSLPPFLGQVNPASLVPRLRRQATALNLAYCHAIMYSNRPFLLKSLTAEREHSRDVKGIIQDCIAAAGVVLDIVDTMAREGDLFHAFWWTHYVTFCALAVVFVWDIQRAYVPHNIKDDDDSHQFLLELAERCQGHLARATASNSPSGRYSIILQELREEVKRKASSAALLSMARPQASNQGAATESLPFDHDTENLVDPPILAPEQTPSAHLYDPSLSFEPWTGMQTSNWVDIDSLAFGNYGGYEEPLGGFLADSTEMQTWNSFM